MACSWRSCESRTPIAGSWLPRWASKATLLAAVGTPPFVEGLVEQHEPTGPQHPGGTGQQLVQGHCRHDVAGVGREHGVEALVVPLPGLGHIKGNRRQQLGLQHRQRALQFAGLPDQARQLPAEERGMVATVRSDLQHPGVFG